jgi:hypothetical protein
MVYSLLKRMQCVLTLLRLGATSFQTHSPGHHLVQTVLLTVPVYYSLQLSPVCYRHTNTSMLIAWTRELRWLYCCITVLLTKLQTARYALHSVVHHGHAHTRTYVHMHT